MPTAFSETGYQGRVRTTYFPYDWKLSLKADERRVNHVKGNGNTTIILFSLWRIWNYDSFGSVLEVVTSFINRKKDNWMQQFKSILFHNHKEPLKNSIPIKEINHLTWRLCVSMSFGFPFLVTYVWGLPSILLTTG